MPRLGLGILGAGAIATAFVKRARLHSEFDLVAIHSRSFPAMDRLTQIAPNLEQYGDMRTFLADASFSAVLVCTPHDLHANHASQCLKADKHVLIEKPVATSIVELESLQRVAVKSSGIAVGLPHGDYPYIAKVRELASAGAIGTITAIHSYLDVPGPPRSNWYYSRRAVGGASLDTFPYALGRVLSFCRANIVAGVSYHNRLIRQRLCLDGGRVNSEVDDSVTMILELPEGQQVIVRSSWNASRPEDILVVEGRRGRITVDCWRNVLRVARASESRGEQNESSVQFEDEIYRLDPFDHEDLKLDLFAHYVRAGISNLREVGYAMMLNLRGMQTNGRFRCPRGIYGSDDMHPCLLLGTGYL